AIEKRHLALVLGVEVGEFADVPDRLPAVARIRRVVGGLSDSSRSTDVTERADVEADMRRLAAARTDVQRARALHAPRVNAVARYDWPSASRPYGGKRCGTVGVVASWTRLAGGGELAERRAAAGRAPSARAAVGVTRDQALLEI